MKQINSIIVSCFAIICVALFGSVFTSCSNDDDLLLAGDSQTEQVSSFAQDSVKTVTRSGSTITPIASNFDEVYAVSLSNYVHVYQQGTYGMCGPCSYVSARSIRNPSYPSQYSNASTIKAQLDDTYGVGNWGLYQLYARNDQTSKDFGSWVAGNNMWGNGRSNLKNWIKGKISSGKPCVIPCLYDMSTNTSSAGHFYVIVSLYLTSNGTGSVVGVKDVWSNSSVTYYFSYTDLLSSNWANSQKISGVGNESYSVMSFE